MRPLFAVSWASQAIPAVAYMAAPRRTRAAGLVVLGSLVSVLASAIGEILRVEVGNNLIVSYLSSPVTAACYVWALQEWQIRETERRLFWWGVVAFLVAWVGLVAWFEDVSAWDTYTYAFYALFILGAAIWTLVRRGTAGETVRLDRTDWFWVTVGLGMHGVINAIAGPVGALLYDRRRLDLFYAVWNTRAVLSITSFLVISWGVLRGPARDA